MAANDRNSTRLQRLGFGCLTACLAVALLTPFSRAAEVNAPQESSPEKQLPAVAAPSVPVPTVAATSVSVPPLPVPVVPTTSVAVPPVPVPVASAPPVSTPAVSTPAVSSSGNKEIRAVREQIEKSPNDALLYVRLGYLLLNVNASAEAKTAFDEALKRNEHSHAAMTGEGIVLARAGNLKEAEQVLKAALLRNPNPVRTLYELGLVYEKEGDGEKALAEYKEGIAKHEQGRK